MRQPARMDEGTDRPARPRGARAEYRYGLVLLLLLLTFVVLMTGSSSSWLRPLTVILTGATLLAALTAADTAPRLRRLAMVCVVIAVIGSVSLVPLGRSGDAAEGLVNVALVVLAPIAIARSVLRRRVIDTRTVLAALCIYVLFGMLWAFVYTATGNVGSTSFFAQPIKATSADYLYFSFITQLTVGYGDLTAATNVGRSCAVLEALVGQLYLVTIVAVLVSRLGPRGASSPSD